MNRADVYTFKGVTIEFQNSSISIDELKSRERFYSKLIWVINASRFKGFSFTGNIPNPNDSLLKEFEIIGSAFFKSADITYSPYETELWGQLLKGYSTGDPELRGFERSDIHLGFRWKNMHKAWLDSGVPVFRFGS